MRFNNLISPQSMGIIFWHTCVLGIHTSIPKVASIFLCCPIMSKSVPLIYTHSNGLLIFFQRFLLMILFGNYICFLNNHNAIFLLHLLYNFIRLKTKSPIEQLKHIKFILSNNTITPQAHFSNCQYT